MKYKIKRGGPQSNLLGNLEAICEHHMSYISQLARHSNEVGS